jgi:hypothetical protein
MSRDAFVASPRAARVRDGATEHAEEQGSIAQDVAKIRIWPGAEQPVVTNATDPRLANAGMAAKILNWLDTKLKVPIAAGGRLLTRTVGPGMFWVSGALNSFYLAKNWNDPAFKPAMKAALTTGAGATLAAAATATWAALPVKGALLANRFSCLFGGLAGGIFSTLNMIITLKAKDSTPVEKTAATGSAVTGIIGATFGVLAAFLPAGMALGPLGLGAWGLVFGLTSIGLAVTQLFAGKNKTLNKALGKLASVFT